MTRQWGFLVDLSRCVGCRGCEAACRNEHNQEALIYRRVLSIRKEERGFAFLSLACNHCLNPECIRVCKEKCFYKRRDGIVLHQGKNCNGCKRCAGACPFQAPKVNARTKKTSKCDLCVSRLDRGLAPACVDACIVGALQVVDVNEAQYLQFKDTLPNLPIVLFTKPSIRFIEPNIPQCFWRKS